MKRDIVPRINRPILTDAGTVVPLEGRMRLAAGNAPHLENPDAIAEVVALLDLERRESQPGVDLRVEAYRIARHPMNRWWLDRSEELLAKCATRPEFKRKRRHGILRVLEGPYSGFPLAMPQFAAILLPGQIVAIGLLFDEMERLAMILFAPTEDCHHPRPPEIRYSCMQARAFIGWKFDHLEKFIRMNPHLPTGRIGFQRSRGLAFRAEEFVKFAWALPD